MSRILALVICLLMFPVAAMAQDAKAPDAARTQLSDVKVTEQSESTRVHIKTSSAAKYHAEFMDSPWRLVVDLEDTVYAWRKTPLPVGNESVKQVRGSQYRKGVSRVVVEFTRKVGYAIREDADGLAIIVAAAPIDAAKAQPGVPVASADKTAASGEATTDTNAVAPTRPEPATPTPVPPTATPKALAQARESGAPAAAVREVPVRIAQAQPAPATAAPAPGSERPISLEFKDADVVNLLRILAAESGRNIVISDDVKGKMSISLRNVPWQLALDTILEARGLQRVEKDGVMRIVSTEQLTKERESAARVQEARIKGEAEARAKLAEAQVKEAEAQSKRMAAEAAQREQDAKGPLVEQTIRLSYADPEEVAKTLQGILGIPAEGQKITGPGYLGLPGPIPGPPNPELGVGYQAAPPAGPLGAYPVSVSQDVLAKGLTIRAYRPTNSLFLRLYQKDMDRVIKIIRESLDIPVPQVKIEARMEILDRSALEQIGIQWGGVFATTGGNPTLVGQGFQTTQIGGQTVAFQPGIVQGSQNVIDLVPANGGRGFGPGILAQPGVVPPAIPPATGGFPISFQTGLPAGGNVINLPISALPNAGPLPAAGVAFGLVGTNYNINLALQALATQGKTRTLARPEIVTVENGKATMSLGEEIPYATISSAGTQITFKEALLKLEVTPTVIKETDQTKIKMIVIVENNSRGDVVNLGNAGSPPAINRRKAETQVLIKEGDRLIIGGVTTSTAQHTTRKVPVFGDIPILGWLFKQRENFETGRELVVFITPSVLRTVDATASAQATPTPK